MISSETSSQGNEQILMACLFKVFNGSLFLTFSETSAILFLELDNTKKPLFGNQPNQALKVENLSGFTVAPNETRADSYP